MVMRGYKKKTKDELLKAIDDCVSISQIFALVQHEQIELRMQTMCSASNLPPKSPNIPQNPEDSPLERLKNAVKLAVIHNR
ncbi:MAG: hypothetical protein Q4D44_00200 [Eubacteriales bacterium]|nr:hypothetical protein [Eubacteriales bacterium]